jgi:arginyl-tRNA synthetase
MLFEIEKILRDKIESFLSSELSQNELSMLLDKFSIDILPKAQKGKQFDFATNIAMLIGGYLKKPHKDIAEQIVNIFKQVDFITDINLAGVGFINFNISDKILLNFIDDVNKNNTKNLIKNIGQNKKINIEFCSANPTGPVHIGHTRGAIFGDVLASILSSVGYLVTREYYINDAGKQFDNLIKSVIFRYRQSIGEEDQDIQMPVDLYPGQYILDIALTLKDSCNKLEDSQETREKVIKIIMDDIKKTLLAMNVKHDIFTSEKDIINSGKLDQALNILQENNLLYFGKLNSPKSSESKIDDCDKDLLLFKSMQFGDDSDRALKKADGSWAYIAPDAGYVLDKYQRGFKDIIFILGADHKGYVKRLTAIADALTKANTKVKLYELVNFVKDGEIVKMSKRKGNFLTVNDVLDEVPADLLRFLILTRKAESVIDLDIAQALSQTKDNPIFYVQYAHSRCCSILNKAGQVLDDNLTIKELEQEQRKILIFASGYTRALDLSAKNLEPYYLVNFVISLSAMFHQLWNMGNENKMLRFLNPEENKKHTLNLKILITIKNIISSCLEIIGVKPLERM